MVSIAEFKKLVSPLDAPRLFAIDAVTFEPVALPASLQTIGPAFRPGADRLIDAVLPQDRGEFVRLTSGVITHDHTDGTLRFVDGIIRRIMTVRVSTPRMLHIACIEDVGAHTTAPEEAAVPRRAARFQAAGFARVDRGGHIIAADAGFCDILDLPIQEAQSANPFSFVHPDDSAAMFDALGQARSEPGRLIHVELRSGGGDQWRILEWLIVLVADKDTQPYLMVSLLDMNDDVLASSHAEIDELTGLLSQSGMNLRISDTDSSGAVIVVDLDDFKQINDQHGHWTGDEVLNGVAERLKSAIREGDLLARIHGDEFVVLLPNTTSVDTVNRTIAQLLSALDAAIVVDGTAHQTSATAGYTMFASDETPADILDRADRDMYRRKSAMRQLSNTDAAENTALHD